MHGPPMYPIMLSKLKHIIPMKTKKHIRPMGLKRNPKLFAIFWATTFKWISKQQSRQLNSMRYTDRIPADALGDLINSRIATSPINTHIPRFSILVTKTSLGIFIWRSTSAWVYTAWEAEAEELEAPGGGGGAPFEDGFLSHDGTLDPPSEVLVACALDLCIKMREYWWSERLS